MSRAGFTINERLWYTGMNEHLGRHWLLLRGLSRESAHWGDFSSLLQMRLPHADIAMLDLPGTGAHCRDVSPGALTDITDSLRAQAAPSSD